MRCFLVAFLTACLAGCLPLGHKLLTLEIRQDDEVLLSTTFDVGDTSTEAEIWDSAGEVPFSTKVDAIEPSDADPLTAEVEGSVQIRILWTDSVESAVTLEGLRLVRSAPESDDWRLPSAEIRRA
jgi:hypothetical protein